MKSLKDEFLYGAHPFDGIAQEDAVDRFHGVIESIHYSIQEMTKYNTTVLNGVEAIFVVNLTG